MKVLNVTFKNDYEGKFCGVYILPRIFFKIKNRIIIISKNHFFECVIYYGSPKW